MAVKLSDCLVQARKTGRGMPSSGEALFDLYVAEIGIQKPVAEYQFRPDRRWRFDRAWVELRIAFEIEGGTWSGGRHTRGAGYEADCEKYSVAALTGWKVFRVTTRMVESGYAAQLLEVIFGRASDVPYLPRKGRSLQGRKAGR